LFTTGFWAASPETNGDREEEEEDEIAEVSAGSALYRDSRSADTITV